MARFTAVLETARPIGEVFDYLADFTNVQAWDPGTVRAERLDRGDVTVGSRFRLTVAVAGGETDLVYEVTEFHRPHRIVLLGQNAASRSLDTITLAPVGAVTRVTYDADLALKGLAKPFQPLLWLVFPKAGREAAEGLRGVLDAELVHAD